MSYLRVLKPIACKASGYGSLEVTITKEEMCRFSIFNENGDIILDIDLSPKERDLLLEDIKEQLNELKAE